MKYHLKSVGQDTKTSIVINPTFPLVKAHANVRGFLACITVGCTCGAVYGLYKNDYRLFGSCSLGAAMCAGAYNFVDTKDKKHDLEMARIKHPVSYAREEEKQDEVHPYLVAEKKTPTSYTLNSIANSPGFELTPLVGDYFYKGDVVVFFSTTNCGKTIFAAQMGIDIASGESSVIPMDVKPPVQNVAYISFEMRHDQMKNRLISEDGTSINFPANFNYLDCTGCFGDAEKFLEYLAEMVEEKITVDTVIFIDTITDISPTFFNKEAAHVINSLRSIQASAKQLKGITLTFVVEAHARKIHDWDPLDLESLKGGGNQAALADSVFCLGQASGGADMRYLKVLKTRNSCKPDVVDLYKIAHTTHVRPEYIGRAKEEDILPQKPKATGNGFTPHENDDEPKDDEQSIWDEKIPLDVMQSIYPHYKQKKEEVGNGYGYGTLMKDFQLAQYINNREELSPIFRKYKDFIGEEKEK